MAAKLSVYQQSMNAGNEVLGTHPESGDAIAAFTRAVNTAPHKPKRAAALQMLMIAQSMAGQHHAARETGQKALELPIKDLLRGTIVRDINLARLRYAVTVTDPNQQAIEFTEAAKGFRESIALHRKDPANALEMHVTYGCLGRALDLMGRRDEAYDEMTQSYPYVAAGDNLVYELNFICEFLPVIERSGLKTKLYKRGLELIELTGHTRRTNELRLIMFGGNAMYRFVRRHPEIIQFAGKVARSAKVA